MLLGESRQAIDEDGGFVLPKHFLPEFASGIIVTRGFDRNVMLFAPDEWETLASKIVKQPVSSQQIRSLRRRLFADAVMLHADQNGRIQIPESLCNFADLRDEVAVLGLYDYLEIWDPQIWQDVCGMISEENNGSVLEIAGV